ncbi:shikimate kinase [Isoptericola haloaureus]|uniref:Shikimate kinase n=1 Tax=Isoptericola haloaureus TaxID=1542902 RepID=A0ABU7Z7V9_9MICO
MSDSPLMVLVGPAACGKSTLGELVAQGLGRPFVDLDAVAAPYYAEVGWSIDRLVDRIAAVGRVAAEREWEPARAHAVERVVAAHPGAVVALGAGHTSYADGTLRARVATILRPVEHRLLVLPSLDRAEALAELRRRSLRDKGTDWVSNGHDFLAEWFDDTGSRTMATDIVVTSGRTASEIAVAVADMITDVIAEPSGRGDRRSR